MHISSDTFRASTSENQSIQLGIVVIVLVVVAVLMQALRVWLPSLSSSPSPQEAVEDAPQMGL